MTSSNRHRRMFLAVIPALLFFAGPAYALFGDNVSGFLRVTAIDAERDSEDQRSLNQEYSVNWTKDITPWVQLRTSFRYFYVGTDESVRENFWRREYQPTGELIWSHPHFAFSTSARRRKTVASIETIDRVRDNIGATFRSRWLEFPTLTARFDWDHTFTDIDIDQIAPEDRAGITEQDIRNRRMQLRSDYNWKVHNFNYSFSRDVSENEISRLQSTQTQHNVRWNQLSHFMEDRLRFSSTYNFSYRRQTTETPSPSGVFDRVPVFVGLYALDQTPELDGLDTLAALINGNTTDPTDPAINLGENIEHNIGVDLGFDRDVSALYIYTDRESSAAIAWRVYTSDDNFTWEQVGGGIDVRFDLTFNRFELEFQTVEARYIKAVRVANGVAEVSLVTEIEALRELTDEDITTRDQTSHRIELASNYRVSEKLSTGADVTWRRDPGGDLSTSRDQWYASINGRHQIADDIEQSLRLATSQQEFSRGGSETSEHSASYTLLYDPLQTLDFSLSGLALRTYIDDVKSRDLYNASFQSFGNILDGLSVTQEVLYSRNKQFDTDDRFDTWSYRLSTDSDFRRFFDTEFSFLYQQTTEKPSEELRVQRQFTGGVNVRPTRTILARFTYILSDDQDRTFESLEYSANWSMSRSLTTGVLYRIEDSNTGGRSEYLNARLNLSVSRGTSIYSSYIVNDFSEETRIDVKSIQVGIRSSF